MRGSVASSLFLQLMIAGYQNIALHVDHLLIGMDGDSPLSSFLFRGVPHIGHSFPEVWFVRHPGQ